MVQGLVQGFAQGIVQGMVQGNSSGIGSGNGSGNGSGIGSGNGSGIGSGNGFGIEATSQPVNSVHNVFITIIDGIMKKDSCQNEASDIFVIGHNDQQGIS